MGDGFKVDRLGDIAAHARIVALFAVGGKGVGRHGKDGHIVVGTVTGADTAGGLHAVHHRHLHVHEHRKIAAGGRLFKHFHCLLPVLGPVHFQTNALQQLHGDLSVQGIVLGQQHPFAGKVGGGLPRLVRGQHGGALGVVLFCLIHKINFLRVADCLMPCVILAQAVGRWGNFINQEVYGPKVTDPALQWFPFSVFIEDVGEWHYAFFFYESILDLIIFALLFTLMWKFVKKPHGLATAGYFFGYGLVRSVMEPLRDSQFILGSEVAVSQLFAMGMALAGILLFVAVLYFNRRKYGSAFGAVSGEPLAILPKYYTQEQRRKMEEEKKKKLAAAQNAMQAGNAATDEQKKSQDGSEK